MSSPLMPPSKRERTPGGSASLLEGVTLASFRGSSNAGAAERANEVFGARSELADADMDALVGRSPPLGIVRRDRCRHAARCHQNASVLAANDGVGRRTIPIAAAFQRIPVVRQRAGQRCKQADPQRENSDMT